MKRKHSNMCFSFENMGDTSDKCANARWFLFHTICKIIHFLMKGCVLEYITEIKGDKSMHECAKGVSV